MIRYQILDNDKTTVNGHVMAATNYASNHNRALAMIGDPVFCPACKTTGHIIPQGPRHSTRYHGREPALDRDLCACQCRPYPLLINSRTDMREIFTTEEVVAQGFGSWVGVPKQSTTEDSDELLEQYFEILDEYQQTPEGYRYDLLDDSSVLHKSQDLSSGKTISHKSANLNVVMWLNKSGTIRS